MCNVSSTDQALAPSMASQATDENNFIHTSFYEFPEVFGDIVFGSPKDECRGSGICSVVALADAPAASRHNDCRRARARLRPDAAGGIEVVFRAQDLCSHLLKNVFRHTTFAMPDACELPERVASALGLNGSTLVPGTYPIRRTTNGYAFSIRIA